MALSATLRLLPLLFLWASALQPQSPDPLSLVRRAVALEKENASQELRVAFRERVVSQDLDANGKVTKTSAKVHDVLMIEGSPQRILLEENSRLVPAVEMASQQEFLRRVVDLRSNETPAQRRARVEEFEKKRAQFREAVEEIPEAFQFELAGTEVLGGRPCHLLRATPQPGFRPRNRFGKLFAHTYGKIWIDKESGHWVRVEGELRETVNLGWIFVQMQKETKAVAEQRPFPGAGWKMSSLWYRTSLRVGLFVHYRAEEQASYWAYEPMSAAVLQRALAPGYPGNGPAGTP